MKVAPAVGIGGRERCGTDRILGRVCRSNGPRGVDTMRVGRDVVVVAAMMTAGGRMGVLGGRGVTGDLVVAAVEKGQAQRAAGTEGEEALCQHEEDREVSDRSRGHVVDGIGESVPQVRRNQDRAVR